MIAQWFDSFLQEKIYIRNSSAHTIRHRKRAFKTFCKFGNELSKDRIIRLQRIESLSASIQLETPNSQALNADKAPFTKDQSLAYSLLY
jgi:site-specific recombinase XerD